MEEETTTETTENLKDYSNSDEEIEKEEESISSLLGTPRF